MKLDIFKRASSTTGPGKAGIAWVLAIGFMSQADALAAGFEKAVVWSGRYAGLGSAVTSVVTGPESLFFNPAALAGTEGLQATLNFSPTFSQFTGPLIANGTSLSSDRSFTPVGSAFVSYKLMPKLGIGVGYYVSGGTKAIFNSVDFSTLGASFANLANLKPTLKSDLAITELSVGAGYELMEGLTVGAGYRIVFTNGSLGLATVTTLPVVGNSLVAATINGLSDSNYSGLRFGAQYTPKDSPWGLGAQFRTEVNFTATGTASGSFIPVNPAGGTTPTTLSGTSTTVANAFPLQFSLGGFYDVMPDVWKVVGEYTFTQYNRNSILAIAGSLTTSGGTAIPLTSVAQNWTNQSNFRFGTEYKLMPSWALRAGYVLTTQVVPNNTARATFSSPGSGHTFLLGAGTTILPSLDADLTLEYSTASGTVTAADNPLTGVYTGDYSTNAYSAHIGLTYRI